MARHLLISSGATSAMSSGVEANGAINVQKLSATGPTDLVIGDSQIDSAQVRFLQGTSAQNIATPWIYGRDVISFSGKSYTAPVAATVTDTIAGTAAAAGSIELKFVRSDGAVPEFFSCTFSTTAVAHTSQDAVIKAAFEALTDIPDWLNPTCDASAGATCVWSGAKAGDTAQSGNVWEGHPANIELIIVSFDGGTQTHTASKSQNPKVGYGDGYYIKALENELDGANYGYYNRVQLPKEPTQTAVVGTNYDLYNIVATKDGSTNSQIKGIDNLIEITLAVVAGDADSLILENKLNGYFADFPSVTL